MTQATTRTKTEPEHALYVRVKPGVTGARRSRAGILFTEAAETKVIVLPEGEPLAPGSVHASGAKLITQDDALIVSDHPTSAADPRDAQIADLRRQLAERDHEIAKHTKGSR